MGQETSIGWTNRTFNPWWGCTKVSPGCDSCYAETFDKRVGGAHWGKGVPRRTFGDKHWGEPLKWNDDAGAAGRTDRVFCASMADVMDDEAPEGLRERLWSLIDRTPHLMWQLLTKRPQRYTRYLPPKGFFFGNVILGMTAENQEFYDARIQYLLEGAEFLSDLGFRTTIQTFVSYEPALGPIKMKGFRPNWLIFGGETGHSRRPMELQWAEDIKRQCKDSGIAFFMKQMSAATPDKASALIPANMLLRQFPEDML